MHKIISLYLYCIAGLLVSPELSSKYLPILDGYTVLLFILMVSLRNKLIPKNLSQFFLVLTVLLIPTIVQYYYKPGYVILCNTNDVTAREVGTFGKYFIGDDHISVSEFIKNALKILLGFLLYNWLQIYCNIRPKFIKFLEVNMKVIMVYQLILGAIYMIGYTDFVIVHLFHQKIINFTGDGMVFLRFGRPRFGAGFSEPSFLVVYAYAIYFAYVIISSENKLRSKSLFLIGFPILIAVTTLAYSSFVLIAICILRYCKIGVIFINNQKLAILTILHLGYYLNELTPLEEFINQGQLQSIRLRLMYYTSLYTLEMKQVLFGASLFGVYTQPPITNIIIQTGCISGIFLLYGMWKKFGPTIIVFLFTVLIINPHFDSAITYISLAVYGYSKKFQDISVAGNKAPNGYC